MTSCKLVLVELIQPTGPNNPTQTASQADQVVTNTTDPGRVYYVATDEMGNFYVGDQFKVDQATGNVTLDSSAFDLTGLQSLRLGAVGGLIGASVNEFSTDGSLSQNSDQKVPTQRAVKTYVDSVSEVGGTLLLVLDLVLLEYLHSPITSMLVQASQCMPLLVL